MRARTRCVLAACSLVALVPLGCKSPGGSSTSMQRENLALLAADRELSQTSAQSGVAEAFYRFTAPDAIWLPQQKPPVRGRDAVRQAMQDAAGITLIRTPQGVQVARSREVGWTWGLYEVRSTGADGQPAVWQGKYVTIWNKQRDGTWKVVLDAGNQNPPPAPP